jgi:hypothetical protein
MNYQDYLGYCPISNPDSQLYTSGTNASIPMLYLGYEVLANISIREYGSQELQELNHELLVRIYTIKYIADYTLIDAIIATIQGYISRSIETNNGVVIRTLDNNSISNLLISDNKCQALILALKEYLIDYTKVTIPMLDTLNDTTFINDKMLEAQTLLRKIEYLAYFVIISAQNALFDYYTINPRYHQQLISGEIKPESTGDYIAKCFRPFDRKINYGLNSISFSSKYEKIDKWLISILPIMIERTHLSVVVEETKVVSKIKNLISGDTLSNLAITNPFTSELKEGDIQAMISLEVFALVTLLSWKSGLAWIPIIGSLFPYLDDGPLGRFLGITVCLVSVGFLTQNNLIELRFVPQALFATPTTRTISILFLGLMLGGIFAI